MRKINRALLSVSDKTGLAEFAKTLTDFGVELISTGGTAKFLRDQGLEVTDVSAVTGFPEMMDGRVKTLHPKIHGAFLALRDNPEHVASMEEHGIEAIDLVVINLYPFEQTIAKEGVSLAEAVENIDIGGPAMIRSASKNWRDVAVVTDPSLYPEITDELNANNGSLSLETRQRLATLAYCRTANYDLIISSYLARETNPSLNSAIRNPQSAIDDGSTFPETQNISLTKATDLRYGENPHQKAALYTTSEPGGIAKAEQLHGKEMSFNNYVDAEAAWNLVQDFDELAVAIIKHTNPSGVGVGTSNEEAYRRALSTDPVSAFGGIVAFNRKVDATVAASVNEVFTEVVIAPDFDAEALELFRTKKNLRVLRLTGQFAEARASARANPPTQSIDLKYKQISGGMLVQEKDTYKVSRNDLKIVSEKLPSEDEIKAMLLAWRVCKHVKSNAIVFANENQTIGVGSGQMNRVDSVRIAAMRAERFNLPLKGSVLASDAFFPFRDNVDEAAKFGISAIIQPGGSMRDEESISAANEHGISMVFTGFRHFKH
jgi:phosphoribosylaminoimidazolecarboxamide formyltransferase/IMP cyclohydrolase